MYKNDQKPNLSSKLNGWNKPKKSLIHSRRKRRAVICFFIIFQRIWVSDFCAQLSNQLCYTYYTVQKLYTKIPWKKLKLDIKRRAIFLPASHCVNHSIVYSLKLKTWMKASLDSRLNAFWWLLYQEGLMLLFVNSFASLLDFHFACLYLLLWYFWQFWFWNARLQSQTFISWKLYFVKWKV